MQLQISTFWVGSCLLIVQQCFASGSSDPTGSASGISAEEIDSKLDRLLKTFLERTDKIEESLKTKIEEVQDSFNLRNEELQAKLRELEENTKKDHDSMKAKLRKLEESTKMDRDSMKAEMRTRDNSVKALSEKMANRDESIEAELVSYKEKTQLDFDSMKDTLASFGNKTSNIEDAIKEYAGKEAQCAYRNYLPSTSQTITFDKVYVEVNDNGGYFNAQTGRYTAGTAGVYEVSLSIGQAHTKDNCQIYIRLITSSGSYQDNFENKFLVINRDKTYTSLSGSRFMFLDENESIYLDYTTYGGNICKLYYIKMCVAFYSTK